LALSQKELDELNGGAEVSPEALAELNDPGTTDVGPFASGYKLPAPAPAPSLRDEVATRLSRGALERQKRDEVFGAVASREQHDLSGGLSDEAKGVAGGVLGAIRATGERMRSDAPIDHDAQFDEFGNQIGGATSMAAAGGYQDARDADRLEQKRLGAAHPVATGLTDLASGAGPGAGVRLAVQGLGDSEATTPVGLLKDAAKGAGAALAAEVGGRLAAKVAGKIGGAFAAKAAPEAEQAVAAEAKSAPMTPELLRNVRAEQEIQAGVRVNGRKLGEVGTVRVNGAPLGRVPDRTGGQVAEAVKEAVAPVGIGAPAAAKGGPGLGKNLRDLAATAVAGYGLTKLAKELDIPYAGPVVGAIAGVLAARKASSLAGVSDAVAELVTKAHAAGLDAAAAGLIARQLGQGAGREFLKRYVGHEDSP